jgi:hypothetical protein
MELKCRIERLLLALAMALMLSGIFAGSALAAEWIVEGKTLSELGLTKETVSSTGGTVTLGLPSINLKIVCGSAKGTGQIMVSKKDEGALELSTCLIQDNKGNTSPSCVIGEPLTINAATELVEDKTTGAIYDVLKPQTGKEALAILSFKSAKGKECLLEEEYQITGNAAVQFKETAAEQSLAFIEPKAIEVGLFIGIHPVPITGTIKEKLTGAKAGAKWGVVP